MNETNILSEILRYLPILFDQIMNELDRCHILPP